MATVSAESLPLFRSTTSTSTSAPAPRTAHEAPRGSVAAQSHRWDANHGPDRRYWTAYDHFMVEREARAMRRAYVCCGRCLVEHFCSIQLDSTMAFHLVFQSEHLQSMCQSPSRSPTDWASRCYDFDLTSFAALAAVARSATQLDAVHAHGSQRDRVEPIRCARRAKSLQSH